MISSITRGSSPFTLPNITPNPTIRYDLTLGYGANANLIRDLSGNSNNGTASGSTSVYGSSSIPYVISDNWSPNQKSGVLDLTNSGDFIVYSNIVGPAGLTNSDTWSLNIAFLVKSFYSAPNNADNAIIGMSYPDNQTNVEYDRWSLSFHYPYNGYHTLGFQASDISGSTGVLSTYSISLNKWYMVGLTNDYAGAPTYGSTIFKIWKPDAAVENVSVPYSRKASVNSDKLLIARQIYGFAQSAASIKLGHVLWWNGTALTDAQHNTVASAYKAKYGLL